MNIKKRFLLYSFFCSEDTRLFGEQGPTRMLNYGRTAFFQLQDEILDTNSSCLKLTYSSFASNSLPKARVLLDSWLRPRWPGQALSATSRSRMSRHWGGSRSWWLGPGPAGKGLFLRPRGSSDFWEGSLVYLTLRLGIAKDTFYFFILSWDDQWLNKFFLISQMPS